MANLLILFIPVKMTGLYGEELSPNEEIQIVHDMINRYDVLKGKGVFGRAQILSVKEDNKVPSIDGAKRESQLTDPGEKTQTVVDSIATFLESKSAPTYRLKQFIGMIMTDANVENFLWQKTNNEKLWQMSAILNPMQSDHLAITMKDIGLLSLRGVSMNLVSVNYTSIEDQLDVAREGKDVGMMEWNNFLGSIKNRITVAEVVDRVKKNAKFTFDFLVLICIASIIATVGLIENSTVNLVASMLISPMMGPILAIAFGISIRNKGLIAVGLRNEMLCFFICVFFGFIFGLVMAFLNLDGANWGLSPSWPTPEMAVRGLVHTLAMGCIIATVSGAGVCLSILGGNVSTMVGVAISASLLPPAVNAGLLWGHSFLWYVEKPDYDENSTVNQPLHCESLANNAYQFQYNCDPPVELFILGNLSLSLAALNILCIVLSGVFMLRIKEIVPQFASSTPTDHFFKAQIPLIKEKLAKSESTSKDFSQFTTAFSELYNKLETDQDRLEFIVKWQEVVRNLEKDPVYKEAMKNLPDELKKIFRAGKLELDDFSKSSSSAKNIPTLYISSLLRKKSFDVIKGLVKK